MKGDFSRMSFNPVRHYARVLMQQGRVQLDADWNEQAEILAHRWQQQTIDTIDDCGAPLHHAGFAITTDPAAGEIFIGPGRIYVGGHMCELEPANPPTAYGNQPHLPNPPDLAAAAADGAHQVIYLDVWERHVTAIEDARIREVALGGPDTATRVQTVWQVKALPPGGRLDCADAHKLMEALRTRPSGRLSTAAAGVPEPEDLCRPHPTGGYRGLENRLYRVEVHSGGQLAGAGPTPTFKWSRDNGSVVTEITEIKGTDTLVVASLGRDEASRFKNGDWVEILSPADELQGGAGTLTHITAPPDDAAREITVAADVSAYTGQAGLRLRRWDMAAGAVVMTAAWTELESGVQVQFSAGTYRAGDYWVFAARVADGQVEQLADAPPRGIHHAYCALAVIRWAADAAGTLRPHLVSDCRDIFPPLTELPSGAGCCVHVDAGPQFGQRLQRAINSLDDGGCVCLAPGYHQLEQTIIIRSRRKLRISGTGARLIWDPAAAGPAPPGTAPPGTAPPGTAPPGTAPPGIAPGAPGAPAGPAFLIAGCHEVELDGLAVYTVGAEAAVRVEQSQDVRLTDCWLVSLAAGGGAAAVQLRETVGPATFAGCSLLADAGWLAEGEVRSFRAERCHVRATVAGLFARAGQDVALAGCRVTGLDDGERKLLSTFTRLDRTRAADLEGVLDNLFAPGAGSAALAPVGVAVLTASGLDLERCAIQAGIGVLAPMAMGGRLERNAIVGMLGVMTGVGGLLQVHGNLVMGLLSALWGAGLSAAWSVHANVLLGGVGVRFAPLDEKDLRLVMAGIAAGMYTVPAESDAVMLRYHLEGSALTGAPPPMLAGLAADLQAALRLLPALEAVAGTYGVNVADNTVLAQDMGVEVAGGTSSGDVAVSGNSITGCRCCGILLHGAAGGTELLGRMFGAAHQVVHNRLTVQGMGISAESAGTLVAQNQVQVRGAGSRKTAEKAVSATVTHTAIPAYAAYGAAAGDGRMLAVATEELAMRVAAGGLAAGEIDALATHLETVAAPELTATGYALDGAMAVHAATVLRAGRTADAAAAVRAIGGRLAAATDSAALRLAGDACRALDNAVAGVAGGRGGILVDLPLDGADRQLTGVVVRGNRITGGAGHGVELRAPARSLAVAANDIEGMDLGGISSTLAAGSLADVEVSHNRVLGCYAGGAPADGSEPAGIFLAAGRAVRLADNVVAGSGARLSIRVDGILAAGAQDISLRGNTVRNNGGAGDGEDQGGAGIVLDECTGCLQVADNQVEQNRSRALELRSDEKRDEPAIRAVVTGNCLAGEFSGRPFLVGLQGPLDAVFANNQIAYRSDRDGDYAVVVSGSRAAVTGNIFDEQGCQALFLSAGAFSVVGNMARGTIMGSANPPHQVGLNAQS